MCGIAGLVSLDDSPVDADLLRRMAASLAHRGPDEQRVWIDAGRPSAGLAHARLAVLDPAGGRQPMADVAHPGRCLVFNGEVYNHRRLREALAKWGHRFASDHSDTEVLLPLYHEYGAAMMDHLRGMFAFAVYDGPGRRLLLARDRMGQKPLYWMRTDRHVAFASELKTLLLVPGSRRAVDPDALHLYLQLGYVPSPRTIFRGIQKLPPASRLVVPLDGAPPVPEAESYWSLPVPLDAGCPDEEAGEAAAIAELISHCEELLGELRRLLADAVRMRLEADVPLGFFLSGGLDSSLVLALARRAEPRRTLRTFSVAFGDRQYDESGYAELMARRVGAEHTRLETEPEALRAMLPVVVGMFDEPFADASAMPTCLMARQAREHVTVALSGDGGDEAFGGYDRYRAVRLAARLDGAGPLRGAIRALARLVPRGRDLKSRRSRLRRFADVVNLDPLDRYTRWVSPFHEPDPLELYSAAFLDAVAADAAVAYLRGFVPDGREFGEVVMGLDARTYLPEDVLTKVDRASMAHGLEVRSPLLDHEVVECAMRLPLRVKLGRSGAARCQKLLLRQAAADLLPAEILSRRKMGFGVPVSAWLAGAEADLLRDRLTDGPLASSGVMDRDVLNRYVREHVGRRADHGPRLWSLLVLEEFLRISGAELVL